MPLPVKSRRRLPPSWKSYWVADLTLDYQVDPQLIGGYAAYIGGNVYDFSYASQLAAMKQQLA